MSFEIYYTLTLRWIQDVDCLFNILFYSTLIKNLGYMFLHYISGMKFLLSLDSLSYSKLDQTPAVPDQTPAVPGQTPTVPDNLRLNLFSGLAIFIIRPCNGKLSAYYKIINII